MRLKNESQIILKNISGSAVFYKSVLAKSDKERTKFTRATPREFDHLEVTGSYKQIGYQIGKVFGDNIRKVIQRRNKWHTKLISALNSKNGRDHYQKFYESTKKHFPHILQEIQGMADGIGINFDYIWVMCIKSELLAVDKSPSGLFQYILPMRNYMLILKLK